MWTYILTALCLAAFLFEIYHFFRGFANKDRKEIVFYVRSFKKIKYLAVYLTAVPLYFTGIFYSGKRFWDSIFIAINKVVNLVVLKYEVDCIDNLMTDAIALGSQLGKHSIDADVILAAVDNQNLI